MSRPSRMLRTAEIIAVGSELLTPFRSDTNSLFITARLQEVGIDVRAKSIVGDDRAELEARFVQAHARADLVVLTGGLGPTDDDITRETVAGVLGRALDEDPALVDALERRFASRGYRMPATNRRQALVPRGARALANPRGTAPGLWMDDGDRGVLLLPGPPRELQPMLETFVRDVLANRASTRRLRRRVLKIAGWAESQVEEVVQPVYVRWRDLVPPIATTILAVPGQIELHLATYDEDLERAEARLEAAVADLSPRLQPGLFSTDGRALERVVGDLLRVRGLTVALGESCTGGLVTSRLTDVPGSSAYVLGSVVAYSNPAKTDLLGVPAALIAEHGAVSEPVATAMAEGVRARTGADIGVGVTGIAGPGGATPDKPVGTVALAVVGPDSRTWAHTFHFLGEREIVKQQASQAALERVRRVLAGESG
jgi:nicotinamide-nucleotide amidase